MTKNIFKGKRILVTGGTGSIGSIIVKQLLEYEPKLIRVLSRDETKQHNLFFELNEDKRVRLLIGDIREKERVDMAMEDIDIVFHAAAMKHILSCENDPFESVKTNVLGTQNVISCALKNGVERVVGISTDKATDPVSVMGCTKLLAEKIMLASYHYKGDKRTKFCFVRFGNVLSTRGSVVPLFYKQIKKGGPVTVTDKAMKRFFLTISGAVSLVFQAAALVQDREIFILKMPVLKIIDLARAMIDIYAPKFGFDSKQIKIKIIGKKKGERIYEKLLSKDESDYAWENDKMFIITPVIGCDENILNTSRVYGARKSKVADYSTEKIKTLSIAQIKKMILDDKEQLNNVVNCEDKY